MSLAACTFIKRAGAQQPASVTAGDAAALRPSQLTLTDVMRAADSKAAAARRTAAEGAAASAARLLVREALPKLKDFSKLHIGDVGANNFFFMFSQDDDAEAGGLTAWLLEGGPLEPFSGWLGLPDSSR
ncbi:hypothetical protein HYH03_013304 [Edaphochlamys debaryana]|uniref:Uncharacterized protein n=1 Tax=Edaphochlamys debaryana TaxID=47281 RepID=A0A835XQD5_9CHLO|nr:hypothetical protein HYH03_013304 [Edaphochlamys debaryana]|eukprot:KAG2488161.1 hypothetical protein HYH03_013304 [Edaphochlamys debaryana]